NRRRFACRYQGPIPLRCGDGKRNDLYRRYHLSRDDGFVGRERCERNGFIDLVQTIDALLVDHKDTGALRKKIGAPREGALDAHALARHRGGDFRGCRILGYVSGLGARDHDLADSGTRKRGNFGFADHRSLLEDEIAFADGMHGDGPFGLVERDSSEFHALFSAAWRKRAVISPMIATAISAGVLAPIESPIGA